MDSKNTLTTFALIEFSLSRSKVTQGRREVSDRLCALSRILNNYRAGFYHLPMLVVEIREWKIVYSTSLAPRCILGAIVGDVMRTKTFNILTEDEKFGSSEI